MLSSAVIRVLDLEPRPANPGGPHAMRQRNVNVFADEAVAGMVNAS